LHRQRDGIQHHAHLNQGGRATIGFTARGWFAWIGHNCRVNLGGRMRRSGIRATNELGQPLLQPVSIQAGNRILRRHGTPGS